MAGVDDLFGGSSDPIVYCRRLTLSSVSVPPKLVVVEASGDIDLASVGEFDSCLCAAAGALRVGGRLVVDLTAVGFLAVRGVRSLLQADCVAADRGATVRLVIGSEPVRLPLRVLGLLDELEVFTSRVDAAA
ncbi:STAS domain-containing protein [Pseudonocardia sp. NPDC049154]|uniref:STAS domain-containing protein n=1 Tax=Pseudonocardia sp. NPDC049154 TaxID=3155501 RepID=UPI0033EC37A2